LESFSYRWTNRKEKEVKLKRVKHFNDRILNFFWIEQKRVFEKMLNGDAKELNISSQLKMFLAGIRMTSKAIEFGLTNREFNHRISYYMTHVFTYYNDEQPYINSEFWLARAFLCFHEVKDLQNIINQIYLEALKVIQIISTLNIHYQT